MTHRCSKAHQSACCCSDLTVVRPAENASQETTCSSQTLFGFDLVLCSSCVGCCRNPRNQLYDVERWLAFDQHRLFISSSFSVGGGGDGPRTRSVTNFLVMTDAVKRQCKSQASSKGQEHNARADDSTPCLGTYVPNQTYAFRRQ